MECTLGFLQLYLQAIYIHIQPDGLQRRAPDFALVCAATIYAVFLHKLQHQFSFVFNVRHHLPEMHDAANQEQAEVLLEGLQVFERYVLILKGKFNSMHTVTWKIFS